MNHFGSGNGLKSAEKKAMIVPGFSALAMELHTASSLSS
jgi:hypothetical protein